MLNKSHRSLSLACECGTVSRGIAAFSKLIFTSEILTLLSLLRAGGSLFPSLSEISLLHLLFKNLLEMNLWGFILLIMIWKYLSVNVSLISHI